MKKFLITIALVMTGLILLGGGVAKAGPFDDVCSNQPDASVCQTVKQNPQDPNGKNSLYGPGSILAKATTLVAFAVGVASIIMIFIGGIKFVTSGGDSNNVSSARNTVIYALVGLVFAALAESIVVFVLNKL